MKIKMLQGVGGMVINVCNTNQTEIPFHLYTDMEYYETVTGVLLFVFLLVICVIYLIISPKNDNIENTQSHETCSGDIELWRRNTI